VIIIGLGHAATGVLLLTGIIIPVGVMADIGAMGTVPSVMKVITRSMVAANI